MELFKAHQQWATRPADETFKSLEELYKATKEYADQAREKIMSFVKMSVDATNYADKPNEVVIVGPQGNSARFTHWAFGQMCSLVGAPASYLRQLPAPLAAENLRHGLVKRVAEEDRNPNANLLFHQNGGLILRSLTTDSYSRIWNYEVASRLLDVQVRGWEPARPDIRKIDDRLPLYASDHDMFVFLRNSNLTINEKGSSGAVYRGVIVQNSEVGASALKLTRFLYREMCGNHIIWGASNVVDLNIRHIGDARQRWSQFMVTIRKYAEESASDLEAKIAAAKSAVIGATKEDVLDAVFGKRQIALPKATVEVGYDVVVRVWVMFVRQPSVW